MKNILFALSTLLLVVACAKKTTEKSSQAAKVPNAPVAVTNAPKPVGAPVIITEQKGIPQDIDADLMASLQRSPCFGTCPAFKIDLYTDGKVAYHGYSHVARVGTYTTKVDTAFMKSIVDKAQSINYFSLSDHYPTTDIGVSDVPTTTTYVRMGKNGKKITNNYDPPKELTEFEQWLEAQFEMLNWQLAKE